MKKNSPIVVLDEHPNWLNPLYDEFTNRKVPYIKIDISSASYDPQSTDIYPFYVNRLSPSAGKRGHEAAFPFALNFIKYVESLGARVVNGSNTVLLETSKAQQSTLLKKLHIPQPKTIALNSLAKIEQHIDHFLFPVVLKPNRGGSGMGIQKFETQDTLRLAIKNKEIAMPTDDILIFQEFIQPRDGHIVRVETINKKVAYAMKVFTKGTFNLCPSDSCDIQRGEAQNDELGYCVATPSDDVKFELCKDLPTEIIHAVESIVKEADIECGGIEYVVDNKGQWYVYDVNALSILRSSFKKDHGIDGWGMLAEYLIKEYRKVV